MSKTRKKKNGSCLARILKPVFMLFVAIVIIGVLTGNNDSTSTSSKPDKTGLKEKEEYYAYRFERPGKSGKNSPHKYLLFDSKNKRIYYFTEDDYEVQEGTYLGSAEAHARITYDNGEERSYTAGSSIKYDGLEFTRTNSSVALNALAEVRKNQEHYQHHETRLNENFDIIEFGAYEQDGDATNGNEPIKWLVLDSDNDKLLLLSLDILEFMKYNDPDKVEGVVKVAEWKDSYIRKWLNNDFLKTAFTEEEQKALLTSRVYILYSENHQVVEEETYDKVYLMSQEDVEKYLKGEQLLAAKSDASSPKYKSSNGFYEWLTCSRESSSAWRSFSYQRESYASYNDVVGIRPAIQINSQQYLS